MPPPKRPPEKPKNVFGTLRRIFSYLSESRSLIVLFFVCVIVSAGSQVLGGYMLRPVIDEGIAPLIGDAENKEKIFTFVMMLVRMGLVYGVGSLASWSYARIMLGVSTKALYRIRSELFRNMENLPIRFFDTHTHGELMSLYTNDVDTLREMLSNSMANIVSGLITVVGYFVVMLVLSWQLTLVVLVSLFVMMWVTKVIGGNSARFFIRQQASLGKVNGYIEEMIEGQKVVKVFCHEPQTKKGFEKLNEELCHAATNAHTFANILMPIMNNLNHINYALVAMVGAALAILFPEILTVGTLITFLTCSNHFSRPFSQMSQQINSILTALAGAERIFRVIDEKPEEDNGYVTLVYAKKDENGNLSESPVRTGIWAWRHPHKADGTVSYTEVKGKVELDGVTFGYVPKKTVLKNVSLYAKPGQKIAFVGSTGAGKTTITNLINRFYDVPDGKIRYDGININKIRKSDLRRSLSMVLQDPHLFSGTVMDNIRYGKLDATDEECIAAAKLANADSFIRHLPEGYNTFISGDGSNLSQGQVQLLNIARAAVADPPVLILDEATSSIDTRTEALIEKGMDRLMDGRTVFVIAHRLSTVRNSNAIMVLENGEIIERGDHDDLIGQKGKYYQLYTGAFELS
ncbi:MAG: ABC transporter ATP-binding protein [Clostridia bacterium]|nr:ABC transporter ATP-binding protein [Clostridia bacterium]